MASTLGILKRKNLNDKLEKTGNIKKTLRIYMCKIQILPSYVISPHGFSVSESFLQGGRAQHDFSLAWLEAA
jgi:hypothetical protein